METGTDRKNMNMRAKHLNMLPMGRVMRIPVYFRNFAAIPNQRREQLAARQMGVQL